MRERLRGMLAVAALVLGACGRAGPVSSGATPRLSNSPLPSPSPTLVIHVPRIPDGTYEATVTLADARRFGVFECNPADVDENTGQFVLTLRTGRFRETVSADHPIFHPLFTGVYTGDRKVVTFIFDPNTAGDSSETLRWSFDGVALRFKVITVEPGGTSGDHICVSRMIYQAHPWVKTG